MQTAVHGVVVAECSTDATTIVVIDPATRTTSREIVVPDTSNDPNLGLPDVCRPSLTLEREAFSPDLTREAATYSGEPDGSDHVGYVDLRTGAFVDVTARTLASGFGQQAVHDADPVFSLDGHRVAWVRDGQRLLSYNLTTGQVSNAGALPDPADVTTDLDSTGIVLAPVGGLALLGSIAPNPDGAIAVGSGPSPTADPLDSPNEGRLQVFSGTRGFTNTFRQSFEHTYGRPVTVHGLPADSCDQVSWVDPATVLCDATSSGLGPPSQLYSIALTATTRATVARTLLPANDRNNSSAVVSPDRSQIALVSSRGELSALYRIPASGGQPVEISPLPDDSLEPPVALAWLP